jgi:hypothetical protein
MFPWGVVRTPSRAEEWLCFFNTSNFINLFYSGVGGAILTVSWLKGIVKLLSLQI